MYCQWVPVYPPVSYPSITWWTAVVPESTWVRVGYPLSYAIGYLGSMLPGCGSPACDWLARWLQSLQLINQAERGYYLDG